MICILTSFRFSFWFPFETGRAGRAETPMPRRSAAAATGLTCIPGAVVRLAAPAGVRVAADDPRVSTRTPAGAALVNGPGPEHEVS